jgi:hypothetical protein
MSSKIEIRDPRANFDLIIPDSIVDIGADGVSQAGLSFPTSKLVFHVTTPNSDTNVEQRQAVLRLSINTLSLIQMCQQTLQSVAKNREQLATAVDQFHAQLRESLNGIAVLDKDS